MSSPGWPTIWFLVCVVVVLLEGVALGRPEAGDTLSEIVRTFRFDGAGRVVLLPLWSWLTWHWIMRPASMPMFSWRDGVAITVGLAWALLESRSRLIGQ